MILHCERKQLAGHCGVNQFEVPCGAVLQHVTLDTMGCADMVWLVPDGSEEVQSADVLFVWSNKSAEVPGATPSDWSHVGCLRYPNGTHQHVFGKVAAKAKPKAAAKRTRQALDT